MKAETVYSLSEEETLELGRRMASQLKVGDLVLLEGDLGLGKTVFVRGVAKGFGIPESDVSSPSFTLIQEYRGGACPLFHIDLYRLDTPEEVSTLGLEDILEGGGIALVEWGEKLPPYYRRECIKISFYDRGEDTRQIEIMKQTSKPEVRRGDS